MGSGLPTPGWRDLLEILIVAAVTYRVLRFLVGTRALQIVFGVLLLAGVYVAAFLLRLSTITYLLGVIFTYGAFAAIVVFQPELRSALARLGQARILRWPGGSAWCTTPVRTTPAPSRCASRPPLGTRQRATGSGWS